MPERWDCIYVDRIKPSGRIYLTQPQKYGFMYINKAEALDKPKVRKSIPEEFGQIKGRSNENKTLKATAIATARNRTELKSSNGMVVRGFKGRTPLRGLQTALIEAEGKGLRVKGSTGWLVYISPEETFYSIINGKYKGDQLTGQQTKMIHSCIDYIWNKQR